MEWSSEIVMILSKDEDGKKVLEDILQFGLKFLEKKTISVTKNDERKWSYNMPIYPGWWNEIHGTKIEYTTNGGFLYYDSQ